MAISFQQGEDIIIELPINENSIPVDLTTATSIRVQLYVTKNNVKTKYVAYNKTSKSGYGVCRQKSGVGNSHIIEVLIKRSESVNLPEGVLSFSAVVTFPGGSDFPEGKNSEYNFPSYGNVTIGDAKDEVIP
jgi:hypothetical protein